ncbi:DNA/RNA nuclease SfsA [Aminipila luticellarii]|uniref:DNA/RNA nuclease SfsA n=1 Tax=Aminipila luticellarii TaxID=2507160 RepID=A0A410PV10_9FIRM|nr:DNA/RNA nuclease SfsA [Aminipila luticellarii]QAT42754.1 DNA/RNA nuclease SfsA [Aminipila luticellarii]
MTESNELSFVYGVFQSEIKNRFLCIVRINDEDVTCYIPSSCRLSNFIDMNGRSVLLKPVITPNARTPYAVYAVKYRRGYILLNLAESNRVIESQIHRRLFHFLGKRKSITHEYMIGNYKADLFIHDSRTIVEIKSTLAFGESACFPTVYSERAVKQLKEISKSLDEGYRVCYILVSLNPQVKKIAINRKVDDFYRAFRECVDKGMLCSALSIQIKNQKPEIHSRIEITI